MTLTDTKADEARVQDSPKRGFFLPALDRWALDRHHIAMLIGVLLFTFLAYIRCLGNGWVYDDHLRIVQNPQIAKWSYLWNSLIRDSWWFRKPESLKTFTPEPPTSGPLAGVPRAWPVKEPLASRPPGPNSTYYRPLQDVWEGLNYHLFGTNPFGWHLTSVLLHLGVVSLVFRLAQLLTGDIGAAILAALLFGVLGAHAEPVVWASSATEPLGAFFELAAFCLFIRAYDCRTTRRLAWALALFALATLAHETAVVFPIIVATYVFLLERPGTEPDETSSSRAPASMARRIGAALAWSAPFFGVSIVYLAVRGFVLGPDLVFGFLHSSATPRFAHGRLVFDQTLANHSFNQIIATIPRVLVWYLKLLVIPWYAAPDHGVEFVTARHLSDFYAPLAILAAIAVAAFVLRKSPRRNLYLFCALWWMVTLAPALSLNQIVSLVQDRYLYLPSFAFCVLLADWAFRLARTGAVPARTVAVLGAAVILVNAAALWRAEPIWQSDLSMWQDCVNTAPGSLRCRSALANELLKRHELEGALQQDLIAQKLAPQDPNVDLNLAAIYLGMRRANDAAKEFQAYYGKIFKQSKPEHPHPVIVRFK